MAHVFETAVSGRAKCRGCERKIVKGEARFGERQANIFGEGEMTVWFHVQCAAYRRPESMLETLREGSPTVTGMDVEALTATAELGVAHERLTRLSTVDRAPTGRARCRHCKALIEKGGWRVALGYFEEFRFAPGGYLHGGCAQDYFGTAVLVERASYFSPDLSAEDVADFEAGLGTQGATSA